MAVTPTFMHPTGKKNTADELSPEWMGRTVKKALMALKVGKADRFLNVKYIIRYYSETCIKRTPY